MFFGENRITPQKENCCGCSACVHVCKKQALTMLPDNEGFFYPVLDSKKCVECGICAQVCPFFNKMKQDNSCQKAYVAINRNKEELFQSSSGGIFSLIAKWVLAHHGIVFGAAFDEQMQLHHIGIEDKHELDLLRGSKYLQSDNGKVYCIIREELKKGRWVYYTGTACQVAGLRLFLRKDYPTLICSDLICHGTPSQKAFTTMIKLLEAKYKGSVVKYAFRDKAVNGWSCSSSCYIHKKRYIKYVQFDSIMNAYFKAFISGSMSRESCYNCPYTTLSRVGDITLSDYWGVSKFHQIIDAHEGVSAVLVNTERGAQIFAELRNKLCIEDTKVEWMAINNRNLVERTVRPKVRDVFYHQLEANPQNIIKCFRGNFLKEYCVFTIKRICRKNKFLGKGLQLLRKRIG